MAVGGGSGGHVTPLIAVLGELRSRHPRVEIRFWCDRKFAPQARSILNNFDKNIPLQTILSGKFRRYHHLTFWQHFLVPSLVIKNIGDGFLVIAGFLHSLLKLLIWRPDVVFAKGGYVCLPVGLAASLLGVPLVIHDSDTHPGLTNRILAKHATAIATGAPLDFYPYPPEISHYIGIPLSPDFHPFSRQQIKTARQQFGLASDRPLVVITGGGLGARRLNDVVVKCLDDLLEVCSVVLVSGKAQYDELRNQVPSNSDKFQLHAFVSKGMAQLLGASDVVVARAGATTILELAALVKPTILVPNIKLTGGHQVKNAQVYAEAGAALVIDEDKMKDDPDMLVASVRDLIANPSKARQLAHNFASFARPKAASDMVDIILLAAGKK